MKKSRGKVSLKKNMNKESTTKKVRNERETERKYEVMSAKERQTRE